MNPRSLRFHFMLLTALMAGWGVGSAPAGDIYVATNATHTFNGNAWDTAFTNIQTALSAAGSNDTIYVAGHTFGLTTQIVWTTSHVTVRGGYAATNAAEKPGPSDPTRWPTVFRRESGTSRILYVNGVTNGTLEQVTLSGGNSANGSALLVGGNSQSIRIHGCAITGNTYSASSIGTVTPPAIHVDTGTSVIFSNCVVRGNTGKNTNGGGNAIATGGGLYVLGTATILDSWILDNVVTAPNPRGGGVYVGGGSLTMRNGLVAGNQAAGAGGNLVKGGGGIYVAGGTVVLMNVTVVDNVYEGIRQAGGTVSATNSIVWFNSGNDVTGTVTFAYSNVGDRDYGGNNIRANPLFVNGYYLAAGSPSTNAGSDTATSLGVAGYAKNADGDAYGPTETVNQGWHAAVGVLDLYVSPEGNDANAGTGPGPSEAFRTVGKALAAARDGTRVNVATGTYSQASGETFPVTLVNRFGLSILGTNRESTVLEATGSGQRVATLSSTLRSRLEGITLTGGRPVADSPEYGGGIYLTGRSRGVLLSDCAVTNNSAGDNHQSGYGGGIAIDLISEVSASNVLVSGNVNNGRGTGNGYGGGFYNAGTLAARDSAIRDNSVPTDGSGGGIYNSGIVELRNVLLAGNAAQAQGDGLYISAGAVAALNCTVANNAGEGVRQAAGTVSITNSILWGNGVDCTGTAVTVGYSLVGDTGYPGDHNIGGNPLFEFGYYLGAGSPATNAGSDTAANLGMADYAKNSAGEPYDPGEIVNLGYHYAAVAADVSYAEIFVSPAGDDINNSGTNSLDAFRTITKALGLAQDGTRIHVAAGTYSMASGEAFPLTIQGKLSVELLGTNAALTRVDATGSGNRVMTLDDADYAVVAGMTLTGGRPAGDAVEYGGGLYIMGNSRDVRVSDCIVSNNTAGTTHEYGYGAGMAVDATSEAVVSNCTIVGNANNGSGIRYGHGGGVYSAGTLTICESLVLNNRTQGNTDDRGGGIAAGGLLVMRNVLVAGNVSPGLGDGLSSGGTATLLNCTVAGNGGEGIRRVGGTVTVTNSILWGNGVDSTGGVMLAWSCFSNSTDHVDGGGNISANPLFVDTTYYHLQSRAGTYTGGFFSGGLWETSTATSRCIDAGNPESDYSQESQPNGGRVNLGAYGNSPTASRSLTRGTVISLL